MAKLNFPDSVQPLSFPTVADVQCREVKRAAAGKADLFVQQTGAAVPFVMRRVFTVHAHKPMERGHHAHKACSQAMVCLAGTCTVRIDDGTSSRTFRLDRPTMTLVVPPAIWAEQIYERPGTIMMVMCDLDYDESDYIRDYAAFVAYRRGAKRR